MRVLLAIAITVTLLWGTKQYIRFSSSVRPAPAVVQSTQDSAKWAIKIRRTFDCVPDPTLGSEALLVQLESKELVRISTKIPTNEVILLDPIDGIVIGDNEIYVEATAMTIDDFDIENQTDKAIKVELLRNGRIFAQSTIWSESDEAQVVGSIFFHVEDQDHGHESGSH